ncbi:MAG: hypothetical protein ACREF4_02485 [Gammaproteobacteria bacterium]
MTLADQLEDAACDNFLPAGLEHRLRKIAAEVRATVESYETSYQCQQERLAVLEAREQARLSERATTGPVDLSSASLGGRLYGYTTTADQARYIAGPECEEGSP